MALYHDVIVHVYYKNITIIPIFIDNNRIRNLQIACYDSKKYKILVTMIYFRREILRYGMMLCTLTDISQGLSYQENNKEI